jgi:NADH-quinone oxidoreductase subunit M
MGMFATNRLYGTLSLAGIILGAWYTLSLVRRTFFGRLREPVQAHAHSPVVSHHQAHAHTETPLTDLNLRELCALAVLIVPIFWIGLYPQFFTRRMQPSLQPIVALLQEQGAAMLARKSDAPADRPAQAAAPAASSANSTISR